MTIIAGILGWLGRNPRVAIALVLMLACAVLLGWVYSKGKDVGENGALQKVETQNDEARKASSAAGLGVDACYAAGHVWSVPRGKCVRAEGDPR